MVFVFVFVFCLFFFFSFIIFSYLLWSVLERNHSDQVSVWRLVLENSVFYLPDILSLKIQDNPEISIVLGLRTIVNVIVRVRVKVRVRILILTPMLTLILTMFRLKCHQG